MWKALGGKRLRGEAGAHWQTAAPGQIQLLAAFVYKGGRQAAVPPAIPSSCLFLPCNSGCWRGDGAPSPFVTKLQSGQLHKVLGFTQPGCLSGPLQRKLVDFFFFQVNSSSFLEAASEPILSKASPGSLLVIVLMKKIQVTGAITREGGDI